MARMLNLRDIFELIIDGFDDRSFSEQQLILQAHQLVLHVLANKSTAPRRISYWKKLTWKG
jgi:hypothetical protein